MLGRPEASGKLLIPRGVRRLAMFEVQEMEMHIRHDMQGIDERQERTCCFGGGSAPAPPSSCLCCRLHVPFMLMITAYLSDCRNDHNAAQCNAL